MRANTKLINVVTTTIHPAITLTIPMYGTTNVADVSPKPTANETITPVNHATKCSTLDFCFAIVTSFFI